MNIYDRYLRYYPANDGKFIAYRLFEPKDYATANLLFLHGSTLNSLVYIPVGLRLSSQFRIRTYLIDFRGHGASDGRRGHIDYIGQLENDLSILMQNIKKDYSHLPLYLGAHCAGASVLTRYLTLEEKVEPDGYIFAAPLIVLKNGISKKTAPGLEQICRIRLGRILFIDFLNALGLRLFNQIRCADFMFPQEVLIRMNTIIKSYSYHMVKSLNMRHYYHNFKYLNKPTLVITGNKDKVVCAKEIENVFNINIKSNIDKTLQVIEGRDHFSVILDVAKYAGPWIQDRINAVTFFNNKDSDYQRTTLPYREL